MQWIRQFVIKQGAVIALVLFAVHLLPQEWIHHLFPHNDSEHSVSVSAAGTGAHLEEAHIHCSFEQIEGESCAASEFVFRPVIATHHFAHAAFVCVSAAHHNPTFIFLRGPPRLMA